MRPLATDLASVLYLGLGHGWDRLRPWRSLTTGLPAAVVAPPGSTAVARELAARTGAEAATLGPSTLHLFWDLFAGLARRPVRIFADAAVYPVARWGIERARAGGRPVEVFRHHDPRALARLLAAGGGAAPVVVTDGLCGGCGRVAPLGAYLALVAPRGGRLVIDDSQALGLLGRAPSAERPYGLGGGGSARFLGVRSRRLVTVSSLAKAWGVPLAVLAGSRGTVRDFERTSETRVHASPPSVAALRAAEHALCVEAARGDLLRARLARVVRRFRCGARRAGLVPGGGTTPLQNLELPAGRAPSVVLRDLRRRGVHAVVRAPRCQPSPVLTCVLRADLAPEAVDHAVDALARVLAPP